MTLRQISLAMILAAWSLFFVLALREAAYLQAGYSIGVSLNGDGPSYSQMWFPVWRRVGQALVVLGLAGSIALVFLRPRFAPALAWLAFGGLLALGLYDVREYGTLAAPTSIWSVVCGLAIAVLIGRHRAMDARSPTTVA